jgi:hypothetical protein
LKSNSGGTDQASCHGVRQMFRLKTLRSMMLEVLDCSLVLLRCRTGLERPKVPAPSSFGVFLSGIESIFSGF